MDFLWPPWGRGANFKTVQSLPRIWTWPGVGVSDLGSPGELDEVNVHFFWRRVYNAQGTHHCLKRRSPGSMSINCFVQLKSLWRRIWVSCCVTMMSNFIAFLVSQLIPNPVHSLPSWVKLSGNSQTHLSFNLTVTVRLCTTLPWLHAGLQSLYWRGSENSWRF